MTINVSQLGTKAKSKNEMYRILTVEAKIYLPPQKECSIYFIRNIFHGRKKEDIRLLLISMSGFICRRSQGCPTNCNLRIKDLVWFIQSKWNNGSDYLPDDIENKNISRQWLWNLCKCTNNKKFR